MRGDVSREDTSVVREAALIVGDTRLVVARRTGWAVGLKIETTAGTFVLWGDSASLALVADSVATLPPPSKRTKATTSFWGLTSLSDSNSSMRLMRVVGPDGPDLEMDLTNGGWTAFALLGDQATNLLNALRGAPLDPADTEHVSMSSHPASQLPCQMSRSVARTTGVDSRPACVPPRSGRQARPLVRNPMPRYPAALRRAGVEGKVVLEFVVDTAGRIEPRTVFLKHSDNPLFARAVRDVLLQNFYMPAEVDGHKVRELVEEPFVFTIP
jgi:TonB family protein